MCAQQVPHADGHTSGPALFLQGERVPIKGVSWVRAHMPGICSDRGLLHLAGSVSSVSSVYVQNSGLEQQSIFMLRDLSRGMFLDLFHMWPLCACTAALSHQPCQPLFKWALCSCPWAHCHCAQQAVRVMHHCEL